MRNYYVCILASKRLVLYIGVTNDLQRRIYEHKHGIHEGFTKQYNVDRLMYSNVLAASRKLSHARSN
jgi:putative endonuclease